MKALPLLAKYGLVVLTIILLVVQNLRPQGNDINASTTSIFHQGMTTRTTQKRKVDRLWCPKATCHDSYLCQPCQRRFLVILAMGRSASTTLTWMLDRLPGLRMARENNNAVGNMRLAIDSTRRDPVFVRNLNNSAWMHNPIPEGVFGCVTQSMIESINPPPPNALGNISSDSDTSNKNNNNGEYSYEEDLDNILGFKTIRYHSGPEQVSTLTTKVDFLAESFPCARFIVNFRSNVQAQSKSVLFKGKKDVREKLARKNKVLQTMAKILQSRHNASVQVLDSEIWTRNVSFFNEKVVDWLGYSHECHFERILEYNTHRHGYGQGYIEASMSPYCRYLGS